MMCLQEQGIGGGVDRRSDGLKDGFSDVLGCLWCLRSGWQALVTDTEQVE